MKLRRVRVEGGLEVQDLDQDGRWQPPARLHDVGNPDALRALAGLLGGTWRIEMADPAGPHHLIRVALMSRLPLTGPRQTPAFRPGLHKIQTEDDGHPGAEDLPTDLLSRPALTATITNVAGTDIVTCHMKSKLFTFDRYGHDAGSHVYTQRFDSDVFPSLATRLISKPVYS